ncbi:oligopeptide ABC transporter permease [Spiroplasma helicoides]|uniref:Oligopeptide ABC transporter permease n=1 Tax=Spiroplasma helicoides TaxID=216938 RepID=A0A1B3SKI6_9MOLU|nr:oligopeptide ABC transporter permease OppB [Spiroplasma helicoides]AOG60451.1 oligopeptide ABC transporter permease [Spiroplasma helicoides]
MENRSNDLTEASQIDQLFNEVSLDHEVKKTNKSFFEKFKYFLLKVNESRLEFVQKVPLFSYSLKRIIYAFITLYVAIIVSYALLRAVTTDTTYIMDLNLDKLGIKYGSPEYNNLVNNRKKLYGADGPLLKQIFIYLRNVTPIIPKDIIRDPIINSSGEIQGRTERMWFYLGVVFGRSSGLVPGSLVQDAFKTAMPVSFMLGGTAVALSYILGVPLGIIAARNKEKWKDSTINGTSLAITAIPALVLIKLLYQMAIYVFGAGARWTDSTLYTKMFPVIGIMLMIMPIVIIETRRYVIDEMTSDYTKFAVSKGLSGSYVFFVHVFRNAGIRIVKYIPEIFILTMFGSSILVERHWTVNGMSRFILDGVSDKDTFLVLGYIFCSASAGVFATLIGDLLLAVLDPRVKLTTK